MQIVISSSDELGSPMFASSPKVFKKADGSKKRKRVERSLSPAPPGLEGVEAPAEEPVVPKVDCPSGADLGNFLGRSPISNLIISHRV